MQKTQPFRMELGKYLLDVSKLIFGGAIISAIMQQNIRLPYVLVVGGFSAAGIAFWGFTLIKKTSKKE